MTSRNRKARLKTAFAKALYTLLPAAFIFVGFMGCKKAHKPSPKRHYDTKHRVKNRPGRHAGVPGFDKKAAESLLIKHVWKGVMGGKPVLFIVKQRPKGMVGVMGVGKKNKKLILGLKVNRRGNISMWTGSRPTAKGLSYKMFRGRFSKDLSTIKGTLSNVVKSGFIEQSFGGGTWMLKKNVLRSSLKRKAKKILKKKKKG